MKRKLLTAIAAIVLIASCSQPSADVPRNVNIIAVAYKSNLNSPENDARETVAQLEYLARESGYTCSSRIYFGNDSGKLEEQATGESVEASRIMTIFGGMEASPQDLNIFYFSGHGALNEASSSILLIASDAANGISYVARTRSIAEALEGIGGKGLILIDACHSGSESPGSVGSGEVFDGENYLAGTDAGTAVSDAFQASFRAARAYNDVYILTACTPQQVSYDPMEEGGNSFFTMALLDYLGFDTDSNAVGMPAAKEITFCGIYQGIWDTRGSIDFGDGTPLSSVQTPQPSRLPSDFVIFRF